MWRYPQMASLTLKMVCKALMTVGLKLKLKLMPQWNVSIMDNFGTKIISVLREYLYTVETWSSVLIKQVSLFQGCPLRGVPLYMASSIFYLPAYELLYPTRKTAWIQWNANLLYCNLTMSFHWPTQIHTVHALLLIFCSTVNIHRQTMSINSGAQWSTVEHHSCLCA